MDLDQAIEHALDGDAILFVGAGFSIGSSNLDGASPRTGRALAALLADVTGLPLQSSLEEAAEEYAHEVGDDELIDLLRHEYTVKAVSADHLALLSVPWRRIYTTNYDNVLEFASSQLGNVLTPVSPTHDPRDMPKARTAIHLNGYIGDLDRGSLWNEFKLTDTSYISATLADSPWMILFRQDVRLARAVFFAGYSMPDLDIRRVLYHSTELHEKTFFVLGEAVPGVTARRVGPFGTLLSLGTHEFADQLERKQRTYVPAIPNKSVGSAVHLLVPPAREEPLSDQHVFDLLLRGEVHSHLVWQSVRGNADYYLLRAVAQTAADALQRKGKTLVITSGLGNGKTLLLEGIKCQASVSGYRVFTLQDRTEDLYTELDAVLGTGRKAVLVIDDYPEWLEELEYIGLRPNPKLSLLLAARSSAHDFLIDRLAETLRHSDIAELSVDQLSPQDLDWLVQYFSTYGLWGERSSWSHERKLTNLLYECDAQFNEVLLQVFASPHIVSRFQAVMDTIKTKGDHLDIVISVLALTILQFPITLDTLIDIWQERVLDQSFRSDSSIRQLINVDSGRVSMRSSVAARYILQSMKDAGAITSVLTTIARVANRGSRVGYQYQGLARSLMRFGNLQLLLPEQNRRNAVIKYYESVKNLPIAQDNPQFWLQFAIATLVHGDLERSGRYFASAYSFARAKGNYDTLMIDNHYSRYLLKMAVAAPDARSAMANFADSAQIVGRQMQRERLHYPYRVAAGYLEVFDKWHAHLSKEESAQIVSAASFVLDRLARLPEQRQLQRYVAQCKQAMEEILQRGGPSEGAASSVGDNRGH